jgi:hypothetical protein
MIARNAQRRFRMAVVDRFGLAGELEQIARENSWNVEVIACSSALELVGESGPGQVDGLAITVATAGPFLTDLLRWTDSSTQRVPSLLVGSGKPDDESARRLILGREHIRWRESGHDKTHLAEWLLMALEVKAARAYRSDHDGLAQALREARMQLFHGFITQYTPPEGPPCGPPLPTMVEEIQPLRDARAQFERAHIQAAVRECGSLKDASLALGISYTSLWRRLR